MTPDEAYEEALHRIHEAEETGAVELDLSGWNQTIGDYSGLERLNRLPPELGRLISLQKLNLSWCEQLNDISLLARLPSIQSLDLSHRKQLKGNLSPLAGLTSLQSLDLMGCERISAWQVPQRGDY